MQFNSDSTTIRKSFLSFNTQVNNRYERKFKLAILELSLEVQGGKIRTNNSTEQAATDKSFLPQFSEKKLFLGVAGTII